MMNLSYLEGHTVPPYVLARFKKEAETKFSVELTEQDVEMCGQALIDYFIVSLESQKPCGMPSKLVDELWHAYLLFSKDYRELFNVVGRFVDHVPEIEAQFKTSTGTQTEPMEVMTLRTFYLCAQREEIPCGSDELPLLFAMDSLLPDELLVDTSDMWEQLKLHKVLN
ncbi:MAG: hypothetical protein GY833_22560 [Aestuariibacter sp.]|nr:hypothetical protein [Aestuariibacter sp.]|tara:strand:+ start:243887 stop:244390 length:504 start_codon:yes stop_codon:yes gene_type:complete